MVSLEKGDHEDIPHEEHWPQFPSFPQMGQGDGPMQQFLAAGGGHLDDNLTFCLQIYVILYVYIYVCVFTYLYLSSKPNEFYLNLTRCYRLKDYDQSCFKFDF